MAGVDPPVADIARRHCSMKAQLFPYAAARDEPGRVMASAESDNDSDAAGGGHALHIPVLAGRAVEWLGVRDGGVYVDATFGAGGYTRAILAHRGARLIAIDRDRSAIARGAVIAAQAHGRLQLIEDRFSSLEAIVADCGAGAIDGIVFDLGVSSMQLDEADARLFVPLRRTARHAHGR